MSNESTFKLYPDGEKDLIIYRAFDCSREELQKAMTTPALLKEWLLGPPGWEMSVCEVDLRVGGHYRYEWRRLTNGETMAMGGIFKEISRERTVHTEKFDQPWYPGECIITTDLASRDGKTLMHATCIYESRAARDGIIASGMEYGVKMSYDRLEKLLTTQNAESLM